VASSEAVALERLGRADIDGGVRLSDGARWNQTARDWAFFVDHGETIGVRDDAGELVASAAALPYDGGVGWVSMVLVDPRHRHRGIATRLLGASVEAMRAAGRVPVLDATPAGAAVYRHAGFVPGFAFERWEGDAGASAGAAAARDAEPEGGAREAGVVEVADERAVGALLALDRSVWSIGRVPLLHDFLARPGTRAWLRADASGFAVVRAGRRAHQLGPIIASDGASALALANAALVAVRGPVFIDMPVRAQALADALAQRGFARQRPFVRMALGDAPALAASARVFAVAGPEFG
jgi:GNAT superfamily N-acetyltransferase